METLVIHPQTEAQDKVLRAVIEALEVPFETEPNTSQNPYDPEFVAKVNKAKEDIKNGKGTKITLDDVWK